MRSESRVLSSDFQPSVDIISNWFLLTLQNYSKFFKLVSHHQNFAPQFCFHRTDILEFTYRYSRITQL